jgi:CheY-like chemotaxis protein
MNKLWLIDDDEVFTFLIKHKLDRAKGFDSVKSFLYADEALEEFKKLILEGTPFPSIIFLDINMPRMSGWEFLQSLKNFNIDLSSTKIYIISSSSYSVDQTKAKEYSVEYLTKPLTDENIEMIRKHY